MGKLVRDRIPEIIRASGQPAMVRFLADDEYAEALALKLREETDELIAAARDQVTDELADVLEVLRAIAATNDIPWPDVEQARRRKARERGTFAGRQYLE